MFFHDFWPSFSFLNYFWCLLKDTSSIQNFSLRAWKYKWLTAKNSKSIAIIWCKWKINKDKWLCNFYLNCAKGNNSKKCFQTFFSQSATHKNSLYKGYLAYEAEFFCFHSLKDCRFGSKNFQCSSVGTFFCTDFWNKKKMLLKKDNFTT